MVMTVLGSNIYNTILLNHRITSEKNHETFTNIIIEKFRYIDELPINKYNMVLTSGKDLLDSIGIANEVILTPSQMLIFTAIFLEFGAKVLDNTYIHLPMHSNMDLFYSSSSIYYDLIYETKVADIKKFRLIIENIHCNTINSLNYTNQNELKLDLIYLNWINPQVFSNSNLEFLTKIKVDELNYEDYYNNKFIENTISNNKILHSYNSNFLLVSLLVGGFAVYSLNNL